MKGFAARLFIALYQGLPEWMVRSAVFFVIGVALGVGFVFLSLRPDFHRARQVLLRPQ
jgi:hypothetical protein